MQKNEAQKEKQLKYLGEFLKTSREGNYTQTEMAKRIGYEKKHIISLVERGHTAIPVSKMEAFAREYYMCLGYKDDKYYPYLLAIIMISCQPDTWEIMKKVGGQIGRTDYTEIEEQAKKWMVDEASTHAYEQLYGHPKDLRGKGGFDY
jgi:hypothetical protein